jgi:hypothetical protein
MFLMVLDQLPESRSSGPPWKWILVGLAVAALLIVGMFYLYPE